MPLVDIYCDGNSKVGFGHIRRSITLAQYLSSKGMQVRLIGLSDSAVKYLPVQPKHYDKASLIVFDTPFDVDGLIADFQSQKQPVISLDYFGKAASDLTISVFEHLNPLPVGERVSGVEYILIREGIRRLRRENNIASVKRVAVVLGGGDVLNQGVIVAEKLLKHGLHVTLIEGPFAKSNQTLDKAVTCYSDPDNFCEIIDESDWVVTNGGGCLFEALCLGKPVWIIPQTAMEMTIANLAKENDAVLGIGLEELQVPSVDEAAIVSKNAYGFIDGKGVVRIANKIEDMVWQKIDG